MIDYEYELVQVFYALDREPKFGRKDDSGGLDDLDNTVVIDEKVVPGSHILTVAFILKGAQWGIFTYGDGYTYTLQASYPFTADEGKAHEIVVRGYEKGDFFTAIEDRPEIAFEATAHDLDADEDKKEAAAAAAASDSAAGDAAATGDDTP